jgi:hypothetical protein
MAEEKTVNGSPAATAQGVNTTVAPSVSPVNASDAGADHAATIADLQIRLAKETRDKEIYRAGLLAVKDKKPKRLSAEVLADPEQLESALEAKIEDRELEQKALQEAEAKATADEQLLRENEELRRSLDAAKTAGYAGSGGGSGHNEHSESKPTSYWSDAQKSELRQMYQSRGLYSPDQIEKLVTKAEEIARNQAGGADGNFSGVPTRLT